MTPERLPGYERHVRQAKRRGYSNCGRCGFGWYRAEGHTTRYSESSGCFPLCEECWASLSVNERLPYYAELVDWWETFHPLEPGLAEAIGAAVMEGK